MCVGGGSRRKARGGSTRRAERDGERRKARGRRGCGKRATPSCSLWEWETEASRLDSAIDGGRSRSRRTPCASSTTSPLVRPPHCRSLTFALPLFDRFHRPFHCLSLTFHCISTSLLHWSGLRIPRPPPCISAPPPFPRPSSSANSTPTHVRGCAVGGGVRELTRKGQRRKGSEKPAQGQRKGSGLSAAFALRPGTRGAISTEQVRSPRDAKSTHIQPRGPRVLVCTSWCDLTRGSGGDAQFLAAGYAVIYLHRDSCAKPFLRAFKVPPFSHSVGSPPNYLDKGLPARTPRSLYTAFGPPAWPPNANAFKATHAPSTLTARSLAPFDE